MEIFLKKIRPYTLIIALLSAIVLGSLVGYLLGEKAVSLKPLGDIFLNLIFSIVIPLIFFSVASSIAAMSNLKRILQVISRMLITFLFTSIIAAIVMLIGIKFFLPPQNIAINFNLPTQVENISLGERLVSIFTVPDFINLFSKTNLLALIIFSILMGVATAAVGEKGKPFAKFLHSGAAISMKMVSYVMLYAPIGFFAYFAVLIGEFGPKLLTNYAQVSLLFYPLALFYLLIGISFYAFLAGGKSAVISFWSHAPLPIITSLATCSSAATLPINLHATTKMGVPEEIAETVVVLGATLHKDGSVMAGMLKIAFLFSIFHLDFSGASILIGAIFISLLVGTVIGTMPSGGMVVEVLILSLYGFPPQALFIIAAITILIDPAATMLNVTGDSVCSMLTARLVEGRNWMARKLPSQ